MRCRKGGGRGKEECGKGRGPGGSRQGEKSRKGEEGLGGERKEQGNLRERQVGMNNFKYRLGTDHGDNLCLLPLIPVNLPLSPLQVN